MVAKLDGGCLVTELHEGSPLRDGALTIWNHFPGNAVSLRVLQLSGNATLRNETAEEVLYVIDGIGTANGEHVAINSGIYIPPRTSVGLSGSMSLVSAQCDGFDAHGKNVTVVSLDDMPLQRTGDRSYRELIQQQVTQFVGTIPPGRAPDHHHLYEEVICILDGEGRMWAGEANTPIARGSCIFLPRKQKHCVENIGPSDLRLLGVFYPAGSPAVRY